MNLDQIQKKLEAIISAWDGTEPGMQEERAHIAEDAIQLLITLSTTLKALNIDLD